MPAGVAPKFGSEKVALHGGVAATVAGVALHCATKGHQRTEKGHNFDKFLGRFGAYNLPSASYEAIFLTSHSERL